MHHVAADHDSARRRRSPYALAEYLLVWLVFVIDGAWPVPHVNEPYYVLKAIHYWNPNFLGGDFFLKSADSHWSFFFLVGWLGFFLSPLAMTWLLRFVTWSLLAWSWQRLSFAVVPARGWAVLSAALFATLMECCHMAGEWVIGGVESKGFAFVLVFLALEAVTRNRWNRAWLLLGAASAVHVLVGGWAAVGVGIAWACLRTERISRSDGAAAQDACGLCPTSAARGSTGAPPLRTMAWALALGAVLSLPGLIPALMLQYGVDPHLAAEADRIYVYDRLYHHLDIFQIWPRYIARFALLTFIWALLAWVTAQTARLRPLRYFVLGSLMLTSLGVAVRVVGIWDTDLSVRLARLYWYRLSDVAVPLAVALLATAWIVDCRSRAPRAARRWLAITAALIAVYFAQLGWARAFPGPPPAARVIDFDPWRDACEWIRTSGVIEPDACFLAPRSEATFKWYARRPQVASWKEIPQDAAGIVAWWQRLNAVYGRNDAAEQIPAELREWYEMPCFLPPERLRIAAERYGARYVITARYPRMPLPLLFENDAFAVYRLRETQ